MNTLKKIRIGKNKIPLMVYKSEELWNLINHELLSTLEEIYYDLFILTMTLKDNIRESKNRNKWVNFINYLLKNKPNIQELIFLDIESIEPASRPNLSLADKISDVIQYSDILDGRRWWNYIIHDIDESRYNHVIMLMFYDIIFDNDKENGQYYLDMIFGTNKNINRDYL